MFKPIRLRLNGHKTYESDMVYIEGTRPTLSWGVASDQPATQTAYSLTLTDWDAEEELFSTGWVESDEQSCTLPELSSWADINFCCSLQLRDSLGRESACAEAIFFIGDIDWNAPWITAPYAEENRPIYFKKTFEIGEDVDEVRLYYCGLGLCAARLNDKEHDMLVEPFECLEPPHTDYTKTCLYQIRTFHDADLEVGRNTLEIVVAPGWRQNDGPYLNGHDKPRFFGPIQLSAILVLHHEDGLCERIVTDETWRCGHGAYTYAHLFNGVTFDARLSHVNYKKARLTDAPGGVMRPSLIPAVVLDKHIEPIAVWAYEGGWLYDFGQNISGTANILLRRTLDKGQSITLRYFERLREDGSPYFDNLRHAKACDTFISDGRRDRFIIDFDFTYHGFRYVLMEGVNPEQVSLSARYIHTDLDEVGSFRCGSAVVNAVQDMVLRTEKDNMHSILTDCPQRDERMGWMNDATVRFNELPYNFDCAAMYQKISRDIADSQREDGAIACTAPKVYGFWPADPVCSSFLVAGLEAWRHAGDLSVIAEHFDHYAAWEQCLLDHSDDYIVNYSYYGDWAAPAYACDKPEGAKSGVTPGEFMSTGYSYYNCALLTRFARLLGRSADEERYAQLAESIKKALLDKWYDADNRHFATGSMACQAFALWLGLAPDEDSAAIAKALRDDLVASGYRFTTGNLCTRYLLDALAEYGYIDEAYEMVTREEYPSWGWMIQNEATTVWERFELKDNGGMNSYNHPMYGAVGAWFYSALAGVTPLENGYKRIAIRPKLPKKLHSVQATLKTPRGDLNLRWVKREGKAYMQLEVPFGCEAEVAFCGQERVCGGGRHTFEANIE